MINRREPIETGLIPSMAVLRYVTISAIILFALGVSPSSADDGRVHESLSATSHAAASFAGEHDEAVA